MFQKILDEIKSSSKTINVLPPDEAVRQQPDGCNP